MRPDLTSWLEYGAAVALVCLIVAALHGSLALYAIGAGRLATSP